MLSLLSTSKSKTPSNRKGPSSPSQGNGSTTATATAAAVAADESRVVSLNKALDTLNEVFPNVDVDEFRHMLSTFSEESRLHVITESLLKRSGEGRVRPRRTVEAWEKFRSKTYIMAAKSLLYENVPFVRKKLFQGVEEEDGLSFSFFSFFWFIYLFFSIFFFRLGLKVLLMLLPFVSLARSWVAIRNSKAYPVPQLKP